MIILLYTKNQKLRASGAYDLLATHKPDSVPILPTGGVAKSRILSEVKGYMSLDGFDRLTVVSLSNHKTRDARFCNYLR